MRDFIHRRLDRAATWPVFVLLLALFGLCYLGFEWRRKALDGYASGGEKVVAFDVRRTYTPDEARELLETMGERGRQIYAATQLTLDVLFPLIYGSLFAILLLRGYGDPGYLLLVPLTAAAADLLENLTTAYLALGYDGGPTPVARIAAAFTELKRSAIIVSLVLILVGLAVRLRRGRGGGAASGRDAGRGPVVT